MTLLDPVMAAEATRPIQLSPAAFDWWLCWLNTAYFVFPDWPAGIRKLTCGSLPAAAAAKNSVRLYQV